MFLHHIKDYRTDAYCYLPPAFEDLDLDEDTDFEAPVAKEDIKVSTDLEHQLLQQLRQAERHIRELENQFKEYQDMVRKTFLDDATARQIIDEDAVAVRSSPALADHKDDGNYYFNSYAQNGEHRMRLV